MQSQNGMSDGVTGNTSGFGPEESRFEPWSDNREKKELLVVMGSLFFSVLKIAVNTCILNKYCIFAAKKGIGEMILRGLSPLFL